MIKAHAWKRNENSSEKPVKTLVGILENVRTMNKLVDFIANCVTTNLLSIPPIDVWFADVVMKTFLCCVFSHKI